MKVSSSVGSAAFAMLALLSPRAWAESESGPAGVLLSTFGSLTFAHSDKPEDLATRDTPPPHPSFYLGQIILFGTGRISDHTDLLFELGIETARDAISLDPERAYVQYAFGDYLKLWAGRFHSHMGYFNNAYHHGQYLYSTAFRPRTLAWEDMGGILPIHLIGLSAGGRVQLSHALWFRYALDLGNGRADRPDKVAGGPDYAASKTIVGQLAFEVPEHSLEWGVSAEISRIPGVAEPSPSPPELATEIDERILGAHVAWVKYPVELILEGYREDHLAKSPGVASSRVFGGFVQAGYSLDAFRPYARIERIAITKGSDDLYFQRSEEGPGIPSSYTLLTTGVRFEVAPGLVLKAEYERQIRPRAANVGLLQIAWGL